MENKIPFMNNRHRFKHEIIEAIVMFGFCVYQFCTLFNIKLLNCKNL